MPSPKTLLYAALGIIAGSVILWYFSGDAPEYITAYLLIGVTGTILGFQIAKVLAGEIPWYYPHAIILASYFMMYVAAPAVTVWIGPYSEYYKRDLSGYEISYALGVSAVGAFFYLVGYRYGPKRASLPRRVEWYFSDTSAVQNMFPYMVLAMMAIGLAAWAYGYKVSGGVAAHLRDFGGSRRTFDSEAGGIVLHLGKFIWVASMLWMARYGLKISTFIVIGAASIPLLLYGSRSFIAILLLGTFIVWRFRWTEKVPKLVWVGMAFALVMLMSFYVMLRSTGGDVSEARRAYNQQISTVEGRVQSVTHSFSFIGPMAETLQEMGNKIPYQYGRTLATITYIIPNRIWPNEDKMKYFRTGSRIYTEELFPHRVDKISMAPSIMAEYYINFGWPGVAFLSFATGWAIRWFERLMLDHPHRRHQVAWIAFAALVSVNMLRVMKNGFNTIIYAVYFAIPIILVYWPNISLFFSPPPEGTEDEGIEEDESGYFGWEGSEGELAHHRQEQ